jgi:5-methylcytosine-specific restriction endonuclease McrA
MGSYGEHSVRLKNSVPPFFIPISASSRDSLKLLIRQVLERDSRICQMCGADESCVCPYDRKKVSLFIRSIKPLATEEGLDPNNMRTICSTCADGLKTAMIAHKLPLITSLYTANRTICLIIGHIVDKSKGGEDILSNLRAVCSNFNEGLQNAAPIKPDRLQLLAQIRRATIDDQKIVLQWLLRKFKM